jgi:hypothetical protein
MQPDYPILCGQPCAEAGSIYVITSFVLGYRRRFGEESGVGRSPTPNFMVFQDLTPACQIRVRPIEVRHRRSGKTDLVLSGEAEVDQNSATTPSKNINETDRAFAL